MKQSILLAALAAAPSALAHTVWTTFYVDGVSQGDGVAMRMRKDPAKASFPLDNYASDDMACNVDGTTGVSRVQSVPDASTLTFEMRSWPNDPSKGPLDEGHKGPCAVYLKKVSSAVEDKGAGEGWFKLFDDGYDASSDTWCTDKLIANNGRLSVKLPEGLQGGYYLARPEIVALHNATNGDAQFYTGCAQIFLDSKGSLAPEETVAIPGYVKAGEPSVQFNIYINKNSEYQIPGPKVAKLSASSSTASDVQTTQTEGLKPEGCIDVNANWCGKEVPSYSDETGCWASGENCWKQLNTCYDTAPPTGSSGCEIWQKKCQAINDNCKAKNFNGPPDMGKDLTPKAVTIEVGSLMATSGGGVDNSTPKTSEAPKASSAAATPTPKTTPAAYASSSAAAAPSKATPSAAAASSSEAMYGWYSETPSTKLPRMTVTVPASEHAPAPTKGAPTKDACPKGWECVTKYTTKVVTEIEYVTVEPGSYKKRSLHQRRHAHRF